MLNCQELSVDNVTKSCLRPLSAYYFLVWQKNADQKKIIIMGSN